MSGVRDRVRNPDRRYDGSWALLAAMLDRHVSLPGALCRGQAPAFDADRLDGEADRAYRLRLARAATICRQCPELVRCPGAVVARPLSMAG